MAQHMYGVDFGTSNIKMYNLNSDTILNEKNIIAIKDKTEVYQFGDLAFEMYEKAPANIKVSYPIKSGVIADINNMETLFTSFYKKINGNKVITGADFCITVPTDITEVEKRAFYDVVMDLKIKAKKVTVVEKPIADAVGLGINVDSPRGNMLVNIGADTTEISVISTNGIVLSKIIKIGGNKFDEAICGTIRRKHNLIIGSRTAEQVKINLADAIGGDDEKTFMAYGRNIVSGLPNAKEITSDMIHDSISEILKSLIDSIRIILERTPPELSADIMETGVYLTGGSARIKNLDKLITAETGLKVNTTDNPSESVINGVAKILSDPSLLKLTYIPREKQYD